MLMSRLQNRLGAIGFMLTAGAAALLTGCATQQPQSFDSPEAALGSLITAVRSNDKASLEKILGSDSEELLNSGDAVADSNGRAEFLRLYDEKHRLVDQKNGDKMLEVGATDWPMPIPLAKDEDGWFFDTAAGL